MEEIFILGVGEKKKIKGSFFGGNVEMVYCGMSGEKTFSIGLLFSEGYQGHGLNLFFPARSTSITLDKKKYYVRNVTPENITLQTSE